LEVPRREHFADCQTISTGSSVGKRDSFCATVRAWQIRVKRVACTGNHSFIGRQNGNMP
jgi:hypothetical protein